MRRRVRGFGQDPGGSGHHCVVPVAPREQTPRSFADPFTQSPHTNEHEKQVPSERGGGQGVSGAKLRKTAGSTVSLSSLCAFALRNTTQKTHKSAQGVSY